jgi:hypothetical protein
MIVKAWPVICRSQWRHGRFRKLKLTPWGPVSLTMRHPFTRKSWHYLRRQAAVAQGVAVWFEARTAFSLGG